MLPMQSGVGSQQWMRTPRGIDSISGAKRSASRAVDHLVLVACPTFLIETVDSHRAGTRNIRSGTGRTAGNHYRCRNGKQNSFHGYASCKTESDSKALIVN